MSGFFENLSMIVKERDSMLCVGLDSDISKLPAACVREQNPQLFFNKAIINATHDIACCYKINLAFYESAGRKGMEALEGTLAALPSSVLVIADAKRADIGNTSKHYARAIFDTFGFSAITLNPYMGFDSLEPFFEYHDRGMFVLCLTSNPGADDFQIPHTLYREVARKCCEWNATFGNIGLVTGARYPEQLAEIRQLYPEAWFLIPGIGAQGGDLKAVLTHGARADELGMIINASRAVIFASRDADFAEHARTEALSFTQAIREQRRKQP